MSKILTYPIALTGETELECPGRAQFLAARISPDGIIASFEVSEPDELHESQVYRVFMDGDEVSDEYVHHATVFDGDAAFHIYQKYE
jgi:hypothetical protein